MSTNGARDPPPYIIPVEGGGGGGGGDGVKVYHVHTPFTPGASTIRPFQGPDSNETYPAVAQAQNVSASHAPAPTNEGVQRFVSEDRQLGRNPGMTTCATCQQQVLTEVTYKVGTYAWIMCIVFILCGLVLCCCLIPFFLKHFKDAYHTCPRCQRVLYVDKKKCCS